MTSELEWEVSPGGYTFHFDRESCKERNELDFDNLISGTAKRDGLWTRKGTFISADSTKRCPIEGTCFEETASSQYYSEMPDCACGFCMSSTYNAPTVMTEIMSREECDAVHATWIVGSHGCLTVAKFMRSERTKAESDDEIVLYRLIGNDMPPLESSGQLYMNTLYALEHEPKELWNAKRRWILNRIFDKKQHDLILNALYENGYDSNDILDMELNEDVLCSMPNSYEKLLYTTNQNGARNAAYREAIRDGFRWVLIFDGNGFVSRDTWNSIRNSLREADENNKRVVQIPMIRLAEPQNPATLNEMTTLDDLILNPQLSNGALAEAQIAFRRDLLPHGFTPYDTRSGYGVSVFFLFSTFFYFFLSPSLY